MPFYEYRCQSCRRRVTVLVRTPSQDKTPVCDRCGSDNLTRMVSRFAVHRSAGSGLDQSIDTDDFGSVDPEDPRAMAGLMRQMQQETGEETTPEFDQMVEEMESGEFPEDGPDYDDLGDDV